LVFLLLKKPRVNSIRGFVFYKNIVNLLNYQTMDYQKILLM